MTTPRRTPNLGSQHTRTGLADRLNRATDPSDRESIKTTRGTDELLARAREAGGDAEGPDESTLASVESLLRDV